MIHSIYLIARRDYLGYTASWGFWLGLLFTPIVIGVFFLVPTFAASSQPTRYFAVIESGDAFTKALQATLEEERAKRLRVLLDPSAAARNETSRRMAAFDQAREAGLDSDAAFEQAGGNKQLVPGSRLVKVPAPAGDANALMPYLLGQRLIDTPDGPAPLFAAFIVNDRTNEIEYWSENLQVRTLITLAWRAERELKLDEVLAKANVERDLLEQAADARRELVQKRVRASADGAETDITLADRAPYIVSMAMAFSLWFLIFSVINYLLMGTIEERSNKIFDKLLTCVKLQELLAGKLLAVFCLALTLMAFWAISSTTFSLLVQDFIPESIRDAAGAALVAASHPSLFIPAIISFVLGYLIFGSLFLALGSLCDTIQEAQTLMTPLFIVLMIPLAVLGFAVQDAESDLVQAMSWIPVFTPFLLILRMPTEPPLWEILAQLALMSVATVFILYVAARVYRAGAVHGVGISEVWAFFRKWLPGKKPAA